MSLIAAATFIASVVAFAIGMKHPNHAWKAALALLPFMALSIAQATSTCKQALHQEEVDASATCGNDGECWDDFHRLMEARRGAVVRDVFVSATVPMIAGAVLLLLFRRQGFSRRMRKGQGNPSQTFVPAPFTVSSPRTEEATSMADPLMEARSFLSGESEDGWASGGVERPDDGGAAVPTSPEAETSSHPDSRFGGEPSKGKTRRRAPVPWDADGNTDASV